MLKNETIAAIATGLTNAGIGIIRVSGDMAIDVVDKIFCTKNGLKTKLSHTINYGHIVEDGNIVDEVLVMLMKAPRTYTGEDTVEINCHGGILVLQKVLKLVLKAGARIAKPGEFTKRAFLNGKMDLSKAEAVIDIINAKNDYALKSGMSQLNGNIRSKISGMREKILHEIAYIESALDDPENYSLDKYPKKLEKIINYIQKDIDKLIREYIKLGDISLNIVDTAGIRNTEDYIEKIGVDKAKNIAINADFVLLVIDATKSLSEEDIELIDYIKDKKAIILLNKADSEILLSVDDIKKYTDKKIILFSAKESIGLSELEEEIKLMFYRGDIDFNDQIYITNERHIEALEEAKESLDMVLSSIEEELPEDFYSIDMLNAYESLGSITGEAIDDDLANEIFSKFCMGK